MIAFKFIWSWLWAEFMIEINCSDWIEYFCVTCRSSNNWTNLVLDSIQACDRILSIWKDGIVIYLWDLCNHNQLSSLWIMGIFYSKLLLVLTHSWIFLTCWYTHFCSGILQEGCVDVLTTLVTFFPSSILRHYKDVRFHLLLSAVKYLSLN